MKKAVYNSPFGNVVIEMEGQSLTGLYFSDAIDLPPSKTSDKNLCKIVGWLDEYFAGRNPKINFEIVAKGSPFQLLVWSALQKIGYGQTISYGALAKMLESSVGNKVSPRAVGRAAGCNKIAIIIPCHRVIGANGKLTGYAWGLERKEKLLKLEKTFSRSI